MPPRLPILIVEDERIIALGLELAVEDAGGEVVCAVATVSEAIDCIRAGTVAAAILDCNLADRDITPAALLLIERSVPFVVHTGTGIPAELAAIHPDLPVILKPAPPHLVVKRLIAEVESRRRDNPDPTGAI